MVNYKRKNLSQFLYLCYRNVMKVFSFCLESAVDEKGRLKVDTSFRVEGFPNIFAIGDCTNLNEPKIGALAIEHSKIMAKTFGLLEKGKPPAVYKPG